MSFVIRYAARVVEDLQNGYDYYSTHQVKGLPERFLEDINITFELIKGNPANTHQRPFW